MFASLPRKLAVTNATTFGIASGNCGFNSSPTLCYDADFTPYGQEISFSARLQTTACSPSYKFTGYERDPETGLDYAFARYYSSRLGRFLSPDPLGGSVSDLQSQNAYAYTRNNPLNSVDPSGMVDCVDYHADCSGDFFGGSGGSWGGGGRGLGGGGIYYGPGNPGNANPLDLLGLGPRSFWLGNDATIARMFLAAVGIISSFD